MAARTLPRTQPLTETLHAFPAQGSTALQTSAQPPTVYVEIVVARDTGAGPQSALPTRPHADTAAEWATMTSVADRR